MTSIKCFVTFAYVADCCVGEENATAKPSTDFLFQNMMQAERLLPPTVETLPHQCNQ